MPSRATNKAKGNNFEKRILEFLGGLGWKVERAHAKYVFIGPGKVRSIAHDHFQAFDFICFHPQVIPFLMVQATIDQSAMADKRRKINEALGTVNAAWPHITQVWLRDPNNIHRIIVWDRNHVNGDWVETSFRMETGHWPRAALGNPPSIALGAAQPLHQP